MRSCNVLSVYNDEPARTRAHRDARKPCTHAVCGPVLTLWLGLSSWPAMYLLVRNMKQVKLLSFVF